MTRNVDTHDEIFDALAAFRKLTLLFHSASPWDDNKAQEWNRLQLPIINLATAPKHEGFFPASTRGLCDLARAIAGERHD